MSPEVIKPTGNVEKPFAKGEALDGLKDFQYRKNELTNEKEELSANIDKMNKKLAASMDFFPLGQDTLSKEELNMAIGFIDGELNKLEAEFNSKVEAANSEFKAKSFSREANIVDALNELNSGLETFLAGKLETIISEADMADEDRGAMMARLYPKGKQAYGETEVAAMGRHFRDLDNAANAQ